MSTGFRRSELAVLTPQRFELDREHPVARLREGDTKNGKGAEQPLPDDVAQALKGWLAGKPKDLPVWPGLARVRTSEVIQHDLRACGIPYAVEGLEGPLYADFHALRHSFVALLDKSGASLKEAMQLARHSDPKLTMARYGRARLNDLAGAVNRIPELAAKAEPEEKQILRATGTEPVLRESCPNLVKDSDGRRREGMVSDGSDQDETGPSIIRIPMSGMGLGGNRRQQTAKDGNDDPMPATSNEQIWKPEGAGSRPASETG
jgi:hypothetical protein